MVEALGLKGKELVLEIGTGSGYAAAVLAELWGQVFSMEMVEDLAIRARAVLASLGCRNVSVQVGDGTLGWEEHAPYDSVVISATAPCIPRPLLEQLRPGGCMVLPMGEKEGQFCWGRSNDQARRPIWNAAKKPSGAAPVITCFVHPLLQAWRFSFKCPYGVSNLIYLGFPNHGYPGYNGIEGRTSSAQSIENSVQPCL